MWKAQARCGKPLEHRSGAEFNAEVVVWEGMGVRVGGISRGCLRWVGVRMRMH